ncbi:hypothetical protein RSD66_02225 [Brevundimonas sp. S1H14]|uniref:hypothetical protein n=1 Tax=Brevundimonas TaxID=41275 RepID=UPI0011C3E52A|nr:hypothetical protein [Brevundimonas sp. LPMIX5]
MNLENIPVHLIKLGVTGFILSAIGLSAWGFRLLRRVRPGEIRGSSQVFGLGVVSIAFGSFILSLGAFGSDLSANGQLAWWLALVVCFLGSGVLLVGTQIGVLARFDEFGVSVRWITGRVERMVWSDFRRVRQGRFFWSGAVFERGKGRPFLLSSDAGGADALMLAAQAAGVAGVDAFNLPPLGEAVSSHKD